MESYRIWQIKYQHYGILKYSYTHDFIDFYKDWNDCKQKTNKIEVDGKFREAIKEKMPKL